jgi:6-pyruvoyltetrahydropterin/6-carboxytetrahydropterin synthase
MVLLRRIVRMGVQPADGADAAPDVRGNGYGGSPVFAGWPTGRHVEIEVCCRGEVDPRTGYFLDIKAIDRAARDVLAASFSRSLGDAAGNETAVLAAAAPRLNDALDGRVQWVRWNLTPTYSVEVSPMPASSVPLAPPSALLRQKFEIAAAHRLHVPELSEEENRRLFGRCANPSAHGHNYVIEPCVRVPVGGRGGGGAGAARFGLADLERATLKALIDPFDHRNLNVDCEQFDQSRGGVNPSVENISRVFYTLLAPVIAAHGGGVELQSLTVWETEKTCSTYPG